MTAVELGPPKSLAPHGRPQPEFGREIAGLRPGREATKTAKRRARPTALIPTPARASSEWRPGSRPPLSVPRRRLPGGQPSALDEKSKPRGRFAGVNGPPAPHSYPCFGDRTRHRYARRCVG